MTRYAFVHPFVRGLALVGLATLVSGCMLARSADPHAVIAPQVDMPVDADWPEVDWTLLIQRPRTDRMRDSDRIMVRVGDSRLEPYPGAVWLDELPDMVQALMIEAFEDSGRFVAVGRTGAIRSPLSLVTEIRRFEAVDSGGGMLEIELSLQARLVDHASERVRSSRTFTRRHEVQGSGVEALIPAFEAAMSALFADIADWLLAEGEVGEASGG